MPDHNAGDICARLLHELVPTEWDNEPLSLAHEIRGFLKSVVDEGTNIGSAGGNGSASLYPVISGVEYCIEVTKRQE